MRVLVISLVPPPVLAQVLRELREHYPQGRMVALLGSQAEQPEADEVLQWRSFGAEALLRELRGRRLDLVVVAHTGDQYLSAGYWKAVLLALLCGAHMRLSWMQHKPEERPLPGEGPATPRLRTCSRAGMVLHGISRAACRLAMEAYVAGLGCLLVLVLIGIAITDLTESAARPGRRGGRSARHWRQT